MREPGSQPEPFPDDPRDAEIARLRAALAKAKTFLAPPAGSHYPHGVTYAVQEIDAALAVAETEMPSRAERSPRSPRRGCPIPHDLQTTPCRLDEYGECDWSECPQHKDNEPRATGRYCPLQSPTLGLEGVRERLADISGGAILAQRLRFLNNPEAVLAMDSARERISRALDDIRRAEIKILEASHGERS